MRYRASGLIIVIFLFLFRVGICSVESFFCAGHVAASRALAAIAGRPSR